MARLSIRIDLEGGGRIGPGKIRLLEAVEREGSISAAGAALGMSYRRAWTLVSELNAALERPVVHARVGGRQGGGAALTDFGKAVIVAYRSLQARAEEAAVSFLAVLEPDGRPPPG